MMKKFVLIVGLFFFALSLMAQEKAMSLAERAFQQRDYLSAIRHYNKALRKTNDFNNQKQIAGQIALSYFAMNNYSEAAIWFEDALGDNGTDVGLGIKYASSLAAINQLDEAEQLLTYFLKLQPENNELKLRLAALEVLHKSDTDSLSWVWPVIELNSEVSDYCPAFWNDKLVFASTRLPSGNERLDGRSGQGFSNLYVADYNAYFNSTSAPGLMPKAFNSSFNDGAFAFSESLKMAFWTVCTRKPENCLLYQSSFNPTTKKWAAGEKMSFMIKGYNYGHPAVADDGNTLYFSSNMPGGYGKNDLWKITRKENGIWGIPVNLGSAINSSSDELFPALLGDSLLFFASDRPSSLGGLDVFISRKEKLFFSAPLRLSLPVNSAADDFGLVMNKTGSGGYFSSDRNPAASDDIFSFTGFPLRLTVEGTVTYQNNHKAMPGVCVSFTDKNNARDSVFTDLNGRYAFDAEALNEYRITASMPGYYVEQRVVATYDPQLFADAFPRMIADFSLTKVVFTCTINGRITNRDDGVVMPGVKVEINNTTGFSNYTYSDKDGNYSFSGLKPETSYTIRTSMKGFFAESRVCNLPKVASIQVFNRSNGYDMDFQLLQIQTKKEIALKDIYYDYNKASLRQESMVELNKLASMLRETPAVAIQINSHTDARGRDEYNMELSAQRAATVVNYLVAQGISRDRLIAKGWGEQQLIIPDAVTEAEHQANRRTTFNVLEKPSDNLSETYEAEKSGQPRAGEISAGSSAGSDGLAYRVQILSSGSLFDLSHEFATVYANINPVVIFVNEEGGMYRYEAGSRYSLNEVNKLKRELRSLGYNDCFVVAYHNGERISMSEAKRIEKEGTR